MSAWEPARPCGSGTTGKPKGVMLTHANVLSSVGTTLARVAPLPVLYEC